MEQQAPLISLRQVSRALTELDEAPLFGSSPPFPIHEVALRLKEALRLEHLELHIEPPLWREADAVTDDLGSDLLFLPLNAPPVQGTAMFAMAQVDARTLMTAILGGDRYATALEDHDLREALVRYVALEVIAASQEEHFPPNIALRIAEKTPVVEGAHLTVDVSVVIEEQTCSGRLLLSAQFVHSWRSYFVGRRPTLLQKKARLPIEVQIGRVSLDQEEWQNAERGDLLLLDHCMLDPNTKEGGVILALDGQPLLYGVTTPEGIRIEPLPAEYEETIMASDDEDDEFEDDFDEFEDEEFEEDIDEEEEAEESFADEDLPEEEIPEEEEEAIPEEEMAPPTAVDEQLEVAEELVPPEAIPFTVSVELGRVRLSADKLLNLQPGNLLELDLPIEKGVELVIEGACVGKGELVRIGDLLGVRILELG